MGKADLEKEIRHSQIPKASDPRLPEERNAYADWQAERRQVYNEHAYFEKARQTLGPSMPYKDIGAFRRSYRAKEGSPAHQRSHNLIRDYKDYTGLKQVMRGSENIPKTLADFQDLRYNKSDKYYALLIGKAIREGRQPISVEDGKQGKHLVEHNNYIAGRSYFEQGTTIKQIQQAVNKYAGSGRVELRKDGKPSNKETVRISELTGYVVDRKTQKIYVTHIFKIHYSDTGVHIVPRRDLE